MQTWLGNNGYCSPSAAHASSLAPADFVCIHHVRLHVPSSTCRYHAVTMSLLCRYYTVTMPLLHHVHFNTALLYPAVTTPLQHCYNTVTTLSLHQVRLYAASLYWSVTTITSVGYGDISPTPLNEVEQLVGAALLLTSSVVWAHRVHNTKLSRTLSRFRYL